MSATKKFAVFFMTDPLSAQRFPVSMYAVAVAIETSEGNTSRAESALCSALRIESAKAVELIQAAIKVGLVKEVSDSAS